MDAEDKVSRSAERSAEAEQSSYNLHLRKDAEAKQSAYNLRLRKDDSVAMQRRTKFARSREQQNQERKKRKEAETLRQIELSEFVEETWSSVKDIIDRLPDHSDEDFENRTEVINADTSAAIEIGEWRPYFSSPDIGVFKTTLKSASWEVEKLALQAAPSVVGLQSKAGETNHFFCSGTVIESDKETHTIVTVANLVKCRDIDEVIGDLKINVYLHSNETCEGKLVYHDFYHNICLIEIQSPVHLLEKGFSSNIDAIHFGKSCSRDVVTLGREKETHILVVSCGKIIPKRSKLDSEELVVSTCTISKAEVGGPLMNFDGDLIGMNYYHTKWLQDHHLGCELELFVQKSAMHLKRRKSIIEKIEEQSPAEASGLNEGDIINRVNGVYFSSAVELGAILLDIGARYLSDHPNFEQLGDSSKMAIHIKFGVMGCEREETIVVDKFTSGGLNRWPFPKPIIVHKYRRGKKVLEEWYAVES